MIVLDTNVLSELMRPSPHQGVVSWVDAQDPEAVATTAITVAEILYGIARLSDGKRKEALSHVAVDIFEEDLAGRVFPFDLDAARHYAAMASAAECAGRRCSMADAQIAAICRCHEAELATRNVKDFEVLEIATINPWEASD
ncbi:MAG TPA: type II toxin-antitoxin system VapC family toxin [Arenicellales bacterium]|nr:type II toxin-antitoxin system VapC family toxin [Arenicellales bacterium]